MFGRMVMGLAVLGMCMGCATAQGQKQVSGTSAPKADFGNLVVSCSVDGAELHVDGAFWGDVQAHTGQQFTLAADFHEVEVTSPGYETFKTTIQISRGNTHYLMAGLVPVAGAEAKRARESSAASNRPTQLGSFSVEINTQAALYVDGRFCSDLERGGASFRVPVGEHRIALRHEGFKEYSTTIFVTEYNTPHLIVTMEPKAPAATVSATPEAAAAPAEPPTAPAPETAPAEPTAQ
jgi:hypothetical protein